MLHHDDIVCLTKDTGHIPDSWFYLGYADILIKDAANEMKHAMRRYERVKILQDITTEIERAIKLFTQDKNEYTSLQREWFLKRKKVIDEELKALQISHIKMLISELEVI
jgi:hypothetical protein